MRHGFDGLLGQPREREVMRMEPALAAMTAVLLGSWLMAGGADPGRLGRVSPVIHDAGDATTQASL